MQYSLPDSRPKPIPFRKPRNHLHLAVLILFFPFVVNRALCTGGIMAPVDAFLLIAQALFPVPVHAPSVVRFKVYPSSIWASVMGVETVVSVGTIRRVFPAM